MSYQIYEVGAYQGITSILNFLFLDRCYRKLYLVLR